MQNNFSDIKVLLLVGGKGTRLRSVVSDVPKPLVAVGGCSFLEILIRQLKTQGFSKLVMCSGYLADQIEEAFGDGSDFGISIEYSREDTPLGTGGATKQAAKRFVEPGSRFVVMNGDSFASVDFGALMKFHEERSSSVTIVVRRVEDASRYGTVKLNDTGRVVSFLEKNGEQRSGLVNAGVYVFEHTLLDLIPDGPVSLELDVFPQIPDIQICGFKTDGVFIDIGTPEDYSKARDIAAELARAASDSTCK